VGDEVPHQVHVFALVPVFILTLRAAAPITFYRDIAPIVYRNCSPCHKPGEAAPFPLLSYEDVKRHARQIADVTRRRYMPPWLPQGGYGEFVEERRLSETQIRLIGEWVKQGAPEGRAGDAPAPPPPADSDAVPAAGHGRNSAAAFTGARKISSAFFSSGMAAIACR